MTTELKCIEGWSVVVHWARARLSDFLARYPLATRSGCPADPLNPPADLAPYVGILTPDEQYYVGLEVHSALHPQTLLCYEMNGAPLTSGHGAPLRLVTPLKYGIKRLKRIGTIAFADTRPKVGPSWVTIGTLGTRVGAVEPRNLTILFHKKDPAENKQALGWI